MSGRPPCPYKTLGVARDASADEIKRAFTALALALHPDTSAAPSAQAAEKFARAKEAFDALRDPARRAAHDRGAAGAFEAGYDAEDLARRARNFRRAQAGAGYGAGASARADAAASARAAHAGAMRALGFLLSPRGLGLFVLLPAAAWAGTALLARGVDESLAPYDAAGRERIRAWFNPRTARWETPAPWDPLYLANRAATKMVPRRDVAFVPPPQGADADADAADVGAAGAAAGAAATPIAAAAAVAAAAAASQPSAAAAEAASPEGLVGSAAAAALRRPPPHADSGAVVTLR